MYSDQAPPPPPDDDMSFPPPPPDDDDFMPPPPPPDDGIGDSYSHLLFFFFSLSLLIGSFQFTFHSNNFAADAPPPPLDDVKPQFGVPQMQGGRGRGVFSLK